MGFVPTADKVGQHQVEEKIRVGNLNHIARHVVIWTMKVHELTHMPRTCRPVTNVDSLSGPVSTTAILDYYQNPQP